MGKVLPSSYFFPFELQWLEQQQPLCNHSERPIKLQRPWPSHPWTIWTNVSYYLTDFLENKRKINPMWLCYNSSISMYLDVCIYKTSPKYDHSYIKPSQIIKHVQNFALKLGPSLSFSHHVSCTITYPVVWNRNLIIVLDNPSPLSLLLYIILNVSIYSISTTAALTLVLILVVSTYKSLSYGTPLCVCLSASFIICNPLLAGLWNQSSSLPWYTNTLSSFSISIIFVDSYLLLYIDLISTMYLSSISMLLRNEI